MQQTNDGFVISEKDLELRGPGDFFGIRQSGEMLFMLADIYNHSDMLKIAQEILAKYDNSLEPSESKIITSLNENAIL